MELVTQRDVDQYLETDLTETRLAGVAHPDDGRLVCQQWLIQSAPKRYIHERLYGDLLDAGSALRIVDVGGGLTSLTRLLASRHEYTLAELLAHDRVETAEKMMQEVGRRFIHNGDWAALEFERPDLVIANDVFPNVDQRLELFLDKALPISRRIRLSLTYYNEPRYYMTRRVDGDEILIMLAWDGRQLRTILERYASHIVEPDMSLFERENRSAYPNKRQVLLVEFEGAAGRGK